MKCSTRVCYCCIFRLQPMYVMHKPKLSMYSNWRVVTKDCHPSGLTPADGLSAYNSVIHGASHGIFSVAGHLSKKSAALKDGKPEERKQCVDDDHMIVTHSSQWKKVRDPEAEAEATKLAAQTGSQLSADQKVSRCLC